MTRWSFFDGRPLIRFAGAALVAAGLLLAPAAFAHPDLIAQINGLSERIQAEPENVEWLIRRGDLHRRHEDYAAAAQDFEAARTLEPDHPEIDFYQGRLARETANFAAAARSLDRYLAANPQHPSAWRLRAETALGQGESCRAADAFESAVRYSKAPSPALFRQWVLALLAAGDRPRALAAVDAGLERVGVEVSLLGLGADTALADRDAGRAHSYLNRLPAGLASRPPWSQRLTEADCLAEQSGVPANGSGGCAAGASARLDAQLQSVLGPK